MNIFFIFSAIAFTSTVAIAQSGGPFGGTQSPDPVQVTALDLLYLDLFNKEFDPQEDSLFLRSDLPVTAGGETGYELRVLNYAADTIPELDVHLGAAFVEESFYIVETFQPYFYPYAGDDGFVYLLSSNMYAVAGTIYNNLGESRIVSGWIYETVIEGTGPYSNQGAAFESFIPMYRHTNLQSADNMAASLADLPTEVDLVDCWLLEDGSCEEQACYCLQDADALRDGDLLNCDGFTNPGVVLAGAGAGSAVALAATTRAAVKKPSWSSILAPVLGGLGGGIVGGLFAETLVDSDCRRGARIDDKVRRRFIANELVQCMDGGNDEFDCPISAP